MKTILAGLCAAILTLSAVAAGASDRDALEIEGSYVLYQADGYQRVLSFDRSGNVVQSSDLESAYGFTSGVGAWEQSGPDSAKARIVDFNFNRDTGQPTGPAITEYEFTFGDLVQGKYQRHALRQAVRYGPGPAGAVPGPDQGIQRFAHRQAHHR